MTQIAVLDDYQDVARDLADWKRLPPEVAVRFHADHLDDEAAVADRLRDVDVVCCMRERTPFPRSLIERLPRLRLIVTSGMRNLAIDVTAAAERGVTVCGTKGTAAGTVELTWGLILAAARRIPAEDRALRGGRWQTTLGMELHGRTLGVMGLGRIGIPVARIGLAFGMNVLAWSQNLTAERAAEAGVVYGGKDELLAQADVLTLHLLSSERTRGIVGAAELAALKPGAILVNTSRGPLVDSGAFCAALQSGRLAGAGLDVYDREPLPPDDPLRRAPNLVLTPHLGYVTVENYRIFYGEMLEDIEAFLAGRPIRVLTPD